MSSSLPKREAKPQRSSKGFQTTEGAQNLVVFRALCNIHMVRILTVFTLAKSVFPVPGGPYIRIFRYRLLFFFVFLVAMAISLTRASNCGCKKRVKLKEQKVPRDQQLSASQISTSEKLAVLLQSQACKPQLQLLIALDQGPFPLYIRIYSISSSVHLTAVLFYQARKQRSNCSKKR